MDAYWINVGYTRIVCSQSQK